MEIIKKNNTYGYKVGYRENGSRLFYCYFKTYTYSQAKTALYGYQNTAYPLRSRDDSHILKQVVWSIRPIRRSEYARGIWRETPF